MKKLDEKSIQLYEDWAKNIIVITPEHRTQVMEALKEVKLKRKEVVESFKESKENTHAAWKAVVAHEKKFTDKLDYFEKIAKDAITFYDDQQEKKRQEEQRRLEAEAEAQAEAERKALEARAKHAKGEKKEELLQQAQNVTVAMVSAPVVVEKTEGESTRKIWKARVIDIKKVPREYMIPNEKLLDFVAKDSKGKLEIDGVEFYYESSLSVRV